MSVKWNSLTNVTATYTLSPVAENVTEFETQEVPGERISGQVIFPFFTLVMCLALDSFTKWAAKKTGIRVPDTVVILIASLSVTVLLFVTLDADDVDGFLRKFTWKDMNPHDIMFTVLPILIFEGAFHIEAHEFFKHLKYILVLAVGSFLLAMLFTGLGMYCIENLGRGFDAPNQWTIWTCLLFGCIVSATDPVAVISLLHDLGAPSDLTLLTEGESLLNDGVAIIGYGILQKVIYFQLGKDVHLAAAIAQQVGMVAISVIIGYLGAVLAALLLGATFRNSIKERGIIFGMVYATYIVCELSHGSGVLGLVFLGVCLNRHKDKISEEAAKDNLKTWALLAYWANGIVFILTGIICGEVLWKHQQSARDQDSYADYGWMFLVYIVVLLARLLCLLPIYPIFRMPGFRFRISVSYVTVLWWGGLRGAVALLIAMQIEKDMAFDTSVVGRRVLVYVSGVVLLSLLVEATTAGKVLQFFDLDKASKYRRRMMESIVTELESKRDAAIVNMRQNTPELCEANWCMFKKQATVKNPYAAQYKRTQSPHEDSAPVTGVQRSRTTPEKSAAVGLAWSTSSDTSTVVLRISESEALDIETRGELNHRVHSVLEAQLRQMNRCGALTENALMLLLSTLQNTRDTTTLDVKKAVEEWSLKPFWIRINDVLQTKWQNFDQKLHANDWVRCWLVGQRGTKMNQVYHLWSIINFLITVAHVVLIVLAICSTPERPDAQLQVYEFVKSVCCLSYCFEFMVLLRIKGFRRTLCGHPVFWALIDAFTAVICAVDLVMRIYTIRNCYHQMNIKSFHDVAFQDNSVCPALTYAELVLVMRLVRVVWIMYTIARLLLDWLDRHVTDNCAATLIALNALCMAYEHLNRYLATSTYLNSRPALKKHAETIVKANKAKKKEAQIELAMLQARHSRVAVSMKTQCAVLVFLQAAHSLVEQMEHCGELAESDAALLKEQIREQMISTIDLRHQIEPLPFRDSLQYLHEFGDDAKTFVDLTKPVSQKHAPGKLLFKQGEPASGMYFLHRGTAMFTRQGDTGDALDNPLHAGQFIGEVGVLFGEPRTGDVSTLTDCEVFFFAKDAVNNALEKLADLRKKLVKHYCIHRGTDYLKRVPKYMNWTHLRITQLLMHGWSLNLKGQTALYSPDTNAAERILLMRGKVVDEHGQNGVDSHAGVTEVHLNSFRNANVDEHCLLFAVPKEEHGGRTILKLGKKTETNQKHREKGSRRANIEHTTNSLNMEATNKLDLTQETSFHL